MRQVTAKIVILILFNIYLFNKYKNTSWAWARFMLLPPDHDMSVA